MRGIRSCLRKRRKGPMREPVTPWPAARLRLANTVAWMTWFHMRSLLSTAFFLQTALITPLSFALLKVIAGHWHAGPTVWFDAAVAGLWATTTLATGIIGFQRFQGVLQYLATGVQPAWAVFLPVVAAAALIGISGLPIAVFITLPFRGWVDAGADAVESSPSPALASQTVGYLLALVACCASAALLSCMVVLSRHAIAFEPLIMVPVWLLCGIVAPVDSFPVPVRLIAHLHPLTFAVDVARHPAADSAILSEIMGCLALSAVYVAVAAFGLRKALRHARLEGTLDLA